MTSIHVLGAGVVGLTTAITIQEAYPNADVKIIAEFFPGDGRSIKYTSMWAVGTLGLALDSSNAKVTLGSSPRLP